MSPLTWLRVQPAHKDRKASAVEEGEWQRLRDGQRWSRDTPLFLHLHILVTDNSTK